jgi:hypothetical protein
LSGDDTGDETGVALVIGTGGGVEPSTIARVGAIVFSFVDGDDSDVVLVGPAVEGSAVAVEETVLVGLGVVWPMVGGAVSIVEGVVWPMVGGAVSIVEGEITGASVLTGCCGCCSRTPVLSVKVPGGA